MTKHDPFAAEGLRALGAQLAQPERGYWIAPIRHHSPACAWAVRALIREIEPTHILIEGPEDCGHLLPLLLDRETRPPVAIAALVQPDTDRRVSALFPLAAHSPEYVAMAEGLALGAAIAFIDLPAAERAATEVWDAATALPLSDDCPFTASAYVRVLTRATGTSDGDALWDHLFEARLGDADWRKFFADLGAYCMGIRAADPVTAETRAREVRMAHRIAETLRPGRRVLAVVGGAHAPALTDPKPAVEVPRPGRAEAHLVRFSHAALDRYAGYAAGLPVPGYYQRLWDAAEAANGAPDWSTLARDLTADFAAVERAGNPLPLPGQVELLRLAHGLAALHGRPGPQRQDLLDGAQGALVKGADGGARLAAFRKVMRGSSMGKVPRAAGQPPLVRDANARAAALRFKIDGLRHDRALDLRRKSSHLAASRFCHALSLLDAGFADLTGGPDYAAGKRLDLLFERWAYGWTPQVEARLVERAALGDRVETAAIRCLTDLYDAVSTQGQGQNVDAKTRLLKTGILAGLGQDLTPFVERLSDDLWSATMFPPLARALREVSLLRHGRGPLAAPANLDTLTLLRSATRRPVRSARQRTEIEVANKALRAAVDMAIGKSPPEGLKSQCSALGLATLARLLSASPGAEAALRLGYVAQETAWSGREQCP